MQTSTQNTVDAETQARRDAEDAEAVRKMKAVDWKFVAQISAPFLFLTATLLAVAYW